MTNKNNLFDLTGEIAIVTGGGKGIGKGLATGLADYGATVVILDIDEESGKKAVGEIEAKEVNAVFKKADVTKFNEVHNVVQEIIKEYGKIDILVNNTGTVIRKDVLETSEDEWDKVLTLNLKSHFICAKAVAPSMIERKKGKIIEIGSVSSFLAHPKHTAYAASKGGVRMLIKALAQDLSKYGINVNGIAPGYIKTPMTEGFLAVKENYDSVVNKIPLRRVGVPEDLIGAVVFLASRASDYVTGHLLPVEGGRMID
ncbi:MAG: gluconate 5-dehydrogenase [Thermoanaerobacteraceae bacterium]|nr:gluconate 5-dehydrogenase [Thermoanaerobacteraceae bacterium]